MSTKTKAVTGEGNAPRKQISNRDRCSVCGKLRFEHQNHLLCQAGGQTPVSGKSWPEIVSELRQQRDELLAALKEIAAPHPHGEPDAVILQGVARAAIAHAEGK